MINDYYYIIDITTITLRQQHSFYLADCFATYHRTVSHRFLYKNSTISSKRSPSNIENQRAN